jgi:hypothetical protein
MSSTPLYLTNNGGSLNAIPNTLTELPVCSEVPTQDDQLVNKLYVDNKISDIEQYNLDDYIDLYNPDTNTINLTIPSNTTSVINNNLGIVDYSYSSLSSGTDSIIDALAFNTSGDLYAGGLFTSAGGGSANRIAKWNGSSWSYVGGTAANNGTNNLILSLAIDVNDDVYAGGVFTSAGGISANRIAKWNGSSWSALGNGTNAAVFSMVFDTSGVLYAAGLFDTAGDISANCIAKWNGSSWSAVGGGVFGAVYDLKFDSNGILYAGGAFGAPGGVVNIAKWNGSSWAGLGSGMNDTVWSLAIDINDYVYAGGSFTSAGGISVNNIAKWNGSVWSALGSGVNNIVRALTFDATNDNLYVGGEFTLAGDVSANTVATWNGSSWSAIGSGTDNQVRDLTFATDGNLYIGGVFTSAGGISANNIAKITISTLGPTVNTYVNSKYLYSLQQNKQINVFVTKANVPYTNGLLI